MSDYSSLSKDLAERLFFRLNMIGKRSESLHFNNGHILAGKCKGGLSVTPVELLAIH